MKDTVFKLITNTQIAKNTYKWVMSGDTSDITAPGQFVNIKLSGFYLRRPISVCDAKEGKLTLIFKVVGEGTAKMAEMKPGTEVLVLTGLGNGYNTKKSGDTPVLLGGGAGVPPMYMLAKQLVSEGKYPRVILGFNTREEVFYEEKFRELGINVTVTTADGSYGSRGFVTDVMNNENYTYFYTCGPMPMLKAIDKVACTSGQFSFEERMGCGFGACMGCSCETKYGYKRICRDGPVLEREEIVW